MDLEEYFDKVKGTGVLATSDKEGRVDAAIYAKPHVMDKETVAFITADRLTHHNLQSNNRAAYLFKEDGSGYRGHYCKHSTTCCPGRCSERYQYVS